MAVAIADLRVIDFELSQSEGEAAILSVDTKSPGLNGLAGIGNGMFEFEGAGVGFKGYVSSMPSNILGAKMTVEFLGQPKDFPEKLKAFANTKRELPYYDAQFFGGDRNWGGVDEDGNDIEDTRDPAEILEARSAVFHVDPYTHEIGLSDVVEGTSHIAIGAHFDAASLNLSIVDSVVNEVTCTVSAEWDQQASGSVNIAGRVGGSAFRTFTPPDSIGQSGEIGNASGWSIENAGFNTAKFESERKYHTGEWEDVEIVNRNPVTDEIREQKTVRRHVLATIPYYHFGLYRLIANYDYSQARRETVTLKMTSDAQAFFGESKRKENLGSFGLSSITEDTVTWKWKPDTAYAAGDRVQIGGKAYVCRFAHTSGEEFELMPPDTRTTLMFGAFHTDGILQGPEPTAQWVEVPLIAALPDRSSVSYIDTVRGRLSLEHIALRMRAYLRKRMRTFSLTFRGTWEDLSQVTLNHTVSLTHWSLPGGSASGKVTAYRKVWKGSGSNRSRYVEVTLGVCCGNGNADPAEAVPDGYSPAFEAGYANSIGPAIFGSGGTLVTVDGGAPEVPVDVKRLADPNYAVLSAYWSHKYTEQHGAAGAADEALHYWLDKMLEPFFAGTWEGKEPPPTALDAINDRQTRYGFTMRSLHSGGIIERRLTGECSAANAPAGIIL